MKNIKNALFAAVLAVAMSTTSVLAAPPGTSFSFQGQIKEDGLPLDGVADFHFTLWDHPTSSRDNPPVQEILDVDVKNGLFTVQLDFGGTPFTEARWLGIGIRHPAGSGRNYQFLTPRQPITGAPFALYALSAPSDGGGAGDGFWAANGGHIHNINNLNVGIGTTTPQGRLTVFPIVSDDGVQPALYIRHPQINVNAIAGHFIVDGNGSQAVVAQALANQGTSRGIWASTNSATGFAGYFTGVAGSRSYFERSVGIGTTNPSAPLHVTSDANGTAIQSSGSLRIFKAGAEAGPGMRVTRTTLNDTFSLEIDGANLDATGFQGVGATMKLNEASNGHVSLGVGGGSVGIGVNTPNARLHINSPAGATALRTQVNGNTKLLVTEGGGVSIGANQSNPPANGLYVSGNVGVGVVVPKGKLHVNGDIYAPGHLYLHALEGDGNSGTAYVQARDTSGGSILDLRFRTKNGATINDVMTLKGSNSRVGIGTTNPAQLLHVNGTARVNVLQIAGGADLSEGFDIRGDDVRPGAVVVIDADNPGRLKASTSAYDRTVAGIISGAGGISTGMIMGQEGSIADGQHPVALSGRVYCQVDAAETEIKPGDLLTTSNTPGHAMKVTDHALATGAVIGKAMTSLPKGEKGLVLVLVSLH